MILLFAILTKNASFRSYGTFAYLLRAHIRNINMRRYITSARGHELSGRVRAHAYNYYAWARFPNVITTVQCSICSQLNNKPRVVVTDFRLHHACSIIILWLHSLSGVIRSLLCNPGAFSLGIISVCANTPT